MAAAGVEVDLVEVAEASGALVEDPRAGVEPAAAGNKLGHSMAGGHNRRRNSPQRQRGHGDQTQTIPMGQSAKEP